jgi:MOSC domain-containing protein YiiM
MTALTGEVNALFLGRAQEIASTGTESWWDKPWSTGFYKQRQSAESWLGYEGLRGDEQADRRVHGGVDKAVCVYPGEHYPDWRAALRLPDLPLGAFGENFTTLGLLESTVCIGDVFSLGEARVQVSQPRQPCWKLARRWRIKDLTLQVERTGRTGFYFRVLHHGAFRAGDRLALLERPCPEWTIQRCNEVIHHEKDDLATARALAECRFLSATWKDSLWARATKPAKASVAARHEPPP